MEHDDHASIGQRGCVIGSLFTGSFSHIGHCAIDANHVRGHQVKLVDVPQPLRNPFIVPRQKYGLPVFPCIVLGMVSIFVKLFGG